MKNFRWQLAVGLLLLVAWFCYWPGIFGSFLFDDFANLPALGSTGPVDNWPAFWRYITAGIADPTGRPLALLSFLADARDWPADPRPFLTSNILLHLTNGALLFRLLRALEVGLDGDERKSTATAAFGAGIWVLHPLFVSTTLYVVQREALLATSFVFLALWGYVHGRTLVSSHAVAGRAWMASSVIFGTLLAMLCKANGVLLPAFCLVLASTVLRKNRAANERASARLDIFLLWLPALALLLYLLSYLPALDDPIARPWTLRQRLLTEPRVLLDYLRLLLMPRVASSGLYNDDYVVSRALTDPFATLPALMLVLGLAASALLLRHRTSVLSAAVLFFLVGHALESTILPLELYFEHRNYLPAALLSWPLARAVVNWKASKAARLALAIALLAMCSFITAQRASLWAQPERYDMVSANPASSRALAVTAIARTANGEGQLAARILAPAWQRAPHDLQLAFNYATAVCTFRPLTSGEIAAVGDALRRATSGGQLVYHWMSPRLPAMAAGRDCVDLAVVDRWLAAAVSNPALIAEPGRRQDLASLAGTVALHRGNAAMALVKFDQALAAMPKPEVAAAQAALLGSNGHPLLALRHLDYYDALRKRQKDQGGFNMQVVHAWVLEKQGFWTTELAVLRRTLETEVSEAKDIPETEH